MESVNLNDLSQVEKLKILQATRILKERRKANPLDPAFYEPFRVQRLFHHDKCRNRWLITGNRVGKTTAGAAEAVWFATGTHPYKKITTPNNGWIVSTTNEVQRDVAQAKLLEFLPEHLISDIIPRQRGVFDLITLTNGSKIGFKVASMEREKFEGTSRRWIWLDEEQPVDVYRECLMRIIDTAGDVWCTMTPVEGVSWTYDAIICNENAHAFHLTDDVECLIRDKKKVRKKGIHIFPASIYDNPTISTSEIAEMKKAIVDQSELNARLYGEYSYQSGRIYKEWDRMYHLRDNIKTHADAKYFVGLDTGRCFAAVWIMHDPWNNFSVLDEYYCEDGTINDHARIILAKNMELGIKPHYLIDPSTQFGLELRQHGIVAYDGSNDVLDGINCIRQAMRIEHDQRIGMTLNNPGFYVDKKCQRFVFEIERYIWDDYRGVKKADRNPKQRPKKKDDHVLDAVRYVIGSRPRKPSVAFGYNEDMSLEAIEERKRQTQLKKIKDTVIQRFAPGRRRFNTDMEDLT